MSDQTNFALFNAELTLLREQGEGCAEAIPQQSIRCHC